LFVEISNLLFVMARKKNTLLWTVDGTLSAPNRPAAVATSKHWTIPPESVPVKPEAPRRQKVNRVKPNKRAAVSVPHPGQSYNPTDEHHQAALAIAVKKLQKKEKENLKLLRALSGGDAKIVGNFSADKTWEEDVQEKPKHSSSKTGGAKGNSSGKQQATAEKKKKKKKKKKVAKKDAEKASKMSARNRRHPNRQAPLAQLDQVADIERYVAKKVLQREDRAIKKKVDRKEGQKISNFGRYHHTPLVMDVAPTNKLAGSLRHISGSYVHPALERTKSLEERNIIPARMRHTYNKRKVLKPKGQLTVKREAFGVMPDEMER
jgi:hypothetical protein